MDPVLPVCLQRTGDGTEFQIADPMTERLMNPPFQSPAGGVDVESENVFDHQIDRSERGPAAEIRSDILARTRLFPLRWFRLRRRIRFPDRVDPEALPGVEEVMKKIFRRPVRQFREMVFLQRLDGHIGGREPDPSAPVGSSGIEMRTVPGYRRKRNRSAEFLRVFHMRRHLLRLFR